MHARSWVSSISAVLLVLGLGIGSSACSKQSEGERCSTTNGNDDCEAPLLCTNTIDHGSVCCPTTGATAVDCKGTSSSGDTGTTEGGADTSDAIATDTADTADTTPADTSDTSTPADTATEAATDTSEAGD